MHIIIEGCDKTGKTTLANRLSEMLEMPIKKFSAPTGDPFPEYMKFLIDTKQPHIIDRFYLGENVYGPLKRGASQLDFRRNRIIEMTCKLLGTFNILADGDVETIAEAFEKEKETFVTAEEIPQIVQGFRKQVVDSMLIWNRYKISEDSLDQMLGLAEEWKEGNEEFMSMRLKFMDYRTIGDIFNAQVLVVGEQFGPGNDLVPFALGQGGRLLLKAINQSDTSLAEVVITNAIKPWLTRPEQIEALIDRKSVV